MKRIGLSRRDFVKHSLGAAGPVVLAANALFAHVSQDSQAIWRQHHELIANWRGREAGVRAAEAFVHLNRDNQTSKLPGL